MSLTVTTQTITTQVWTVDSTRINADGSNNGGIARQTWTADGDISGLGGIFGGPGRPRYLPNVVISEDGN